ncbi:MAG TPA: CDP-alcohol phosphatidyltransferase family protein, partial [Propionibacteriaceae bacterium]|nr:CDP-alcohol phosphatidyltransferase family protein [Propionibacteriaceae bacterium]
RYNQLLQTDRLTLSAAFKRAGWRTVAAAPANTEDWPEGASFYRYDTIYDKRNVGYSGPSFGYASMPDQYTLAAFQRNELAQPHRSPVMAEIDLVSSHGPWAPLPRMVDWDAVGDGSVFADMPAQGQSPDELLGDPDKTKTAYGQSIQYSMSTLISFVETFSDDNLVVVAVGDHQPAAVVSGPGASHDVPITIIARDPDVLKKIASWGWQPGMLPSPDAPVWPMDAFRDRFLTAYGSQDTMPLASASPSPR